MKFKTPEMFFLKTEEKLPPIDFDPRKLPSEGPLFQGHEDYAHNPANTYRESIIYILIKLYSSCAFRRTKFREDNICSKLFVRVSKNFTRKID